MNIFNSILKKREVKSIGYEPFQAPRQIISLDPSAGIQNLEYTKPQDNFLIMQVVKKHSEMVTNYTQAQIQYNVNVGQTFNEFHANIVLFKDLFGHAVIIRFSTTACHVTTLEDSSLNIRFNTSKFLVTNDISDCIEYVTYKGIKVDNNDVFIVTKKGSRLDYQGNRVFVEGGLPHGLRSLGSALEVALKNQAHSSKVVTIISPKETATINTDGIRVETKETPPLWNAETMRQILSTIRNKINTQGYSPEVIIAQATQVASITPKISELNLSEQESGFKIHLANTLNIPSELVTQRNGMFSPDIVAIIDSYKEQCKQEAIEDFNGILKAIFETDFTPIFDNNTTTQQNETNL